MQTHELAFWKVGHHRSNGYTFPCDERGTVEATGTQRAMYEYCALNVGKLFHYPELREVDTVS